MKWILSTILGLGVTFSSSLPVFAQPSCNVRGTRPGILALESGNTSRLTSRPDRSQNAQLAILTLSCSAGMRLTISVPTAEGSTPPSATPGVEVWLGLPGGTPLAQVTGAGSSRDIPVAGPFTDQDFSFDLYAISGGLITPGRYTYRLNLKVTPQ